MKSTYSGNTTCLDVKRISRVGGEDADGPRELIRIMETGGSTTTVGINSPIGGVVFTTIESWEAFVKGVKSGEFDNVE